MNAPTTTRVSRLLALLEQYGPMPFGDLRELLPDVKDTVLSAMLSKLKSRGDVDRCEKGWFVAESGEEREPEASGDTPAGEGIEYASAGHLRLEPEQVVDLAGRIAVESVTTAGTQPAKPKVISTVDVPESAPAFVFRMETKNLRVSITGDEADAIAAIRAVAEALEDQARRGKP